jgi:hypothetical protein
VSVDDSASGGTSFDGLSTGGTVIAIEENGLVIPLPTRPSSFYTLTSTVVTLSELRNTSSPQLVYQ